MKAVNSNAAEKYNFIASNPAELSLRFGGLRILTETSVIIAKFGLAKHQ